jgi:uncharacterized membrane-anchored protein
MPHWLAVLLTVTGSVTTLVGFVLAVRKIAGAVQAGYETITGFLRRILEASGGIDELSGRLDGFSASLHELSGAMMRLMVPMVAKQDEHERQIQELTEQINAFAELYTDLVAAISRLRKGRPDDQSSRTDPS